jgi:type II secretory pathway pseudopilin PulG
LVELLVVIAIIGVMVAMTLPALQASREVGRRTLCQANLAQLMLAVQEYTDAFECLPAGVLNPDGPIRSEAKGFHHGWLIPLLPYVDQGNAYRLVNQSSSVYDPANAAVRAFWPSVVICPSEQDDVQGASNYAGCHHDVEAPIALDNRGVLFLNSRLTPTDIPDGLSHTMLAGEKRADSDDLGWMSGTRATLRNTGLSPNDPASEAARLTPRILPANDEAKATALLTEVGGFASAHPGGLLAGFCDGSVHFVAETIDLKAWQHFANRADGTLPSYNLPAE